MDVCRERQARRYDSIGKRAALARTIGLDTSTTAGVLERLEARGLIARTTSREDRRARGGDVRRAADGGPAGVPAAGQRAVERGPGMDAARDVQRF